MTDLITIPLTDDLVHGAAELEPTQRGLLPHRLPAWARAQNTDPQLAKAESQPSGVRLVFDTAATTIELELIRTTVNYAGLTLRPDGIVQLVVDGTPTAEDATTAGTAIVLDPATGTPTTTHGAAHVSRFADLPPRTKTVELWLPHNETIELVALRTDAPVTPRVDTRRTWVHHGSSISHGSNATHPLGTWPAVASRIADVNLVSLGFGGSALLDPFTARTIRDTPADVISLKLGINIVNADLMRLRAFGPAVHGFLDTIREGHRTTPLLVVSPIYCEIHENTPGPGAFDPEAFMAGRMQFRATGDPAEVAAGKLTLTVIRRELERIVAARADANLHYLDGLELYGQTDATEHPLPDALHPDADTQRLIGERFAALAFAGDGALAV
ncbi:hypothetical protein M2152_001695 [Microbacteriaceae bacterium SG_E_30_P1]|uniref:SGNH hydrolase-type esterase domain-containing protein n=1 Tax=Antiquaquibacter oligotrophicus TaxID=2880260 RepID=A0ABT6KNE0_9MICO|nr:SGNH/GDSL hydrolase family protein [Antiquaquibacter oligotrophicus]MDH6181513.1 hypothetical protein [Antiquaquibacter oligotrophicus]UDF12797.1 lipase [Antiquaquibacter oligotrophicus]